MSDNKIKSLIANTFLEVADALETGQYGKQPVIGIACEGSELGTENVLEAIRLAGQKGLKAVLIEGEDAHCKMEQMFAEGEIDGAVTMRLVAVDKEKIHTPGEIYLYPEYYRNFSGYYYSRWHYNSTPGYYTTSKKFIIETNVYSIKTDKIIWSSITESIDPGGVENLTNEVTKVVYKQMIKEGFINQ